jgi:hypothetical protein
MTWRTAGFLLLGAMGCLFVGVVLQLAPLIAIAAVLLIAAGMAAWRIAKPYQPRD